jgi:predicted nicotinamide N-methyase
MTALRFRYQTIEFGDVDIHVRSLRDNLQYSDAEGVAEKLGISSATWPLFGIVWASGEVLAHLVFEFDIQGKRILEVGCGIGLASLVLNHRRADITATDYHPEAENFLLENVELNKGKKIPFIRTGWGDKKSILGEFDLIIGSDLLYEKEHIKLLSGFLDQHARPVCEIIIVDPGRGNHAPFSKSMVKLGYSHTQRKPDDVDYLDKPFKGQILRYQR